MKAPLSWLAEYVDQLPADDDLVERLSITGTYVEGLEARGLRAEASDKFRIGRVLTCERHPDADRLSVCTVDVGEGEARQIVCGAPNVRADVKVAVALPGAVMPDGTKLGKAKLRGIESSGMMLSERELELSGEHAGLMLLDADAPVGEPLDAHVPVSERVLELEITPNRPDCLAIEGVARELAASFELPLKDPWATHEPAVGQHGVARSGSIPDVVRVDNEAGELCPRYMARAFVDVQVGPSPLWMRARLSAAGMRPINNIVDVMNYVMLLCGQPLHAFDAQTLRGARIVVRPARRDEKVVTLDDVERTLADDMLVIADDERTVAIAGVMGAADVEVGPQTRTIVLESACFNGPSVLATSHALGLRSEASSRFEKQLDPYLPERALGIASQLLVDVCGARMLESTVDTRGVELPQPPVVPLRRHEVNDVLGIDLAGQEIANTLDRLGFHAEPDGSGGQWNVTVPHWRMHDTTRPIDLVEEAGRMALDRVPSLLPPRSQALGGLSPNQQMQRSLEDAAVGLGFREAITYSLVPRGTAEGFGLGDAKRTVVVAHPMSEEHVEMRRTLIPSLLDAAANARAQGTDDAAFFEVARTFHSAKDLADEEPVIGLVALGAPWGSTWAARAPEADFAFIRSVVERLLGVVGVSVRLRAAELPFLHPGRAAEVLVGDDRVAAGWVGELHPQLSADRDIDGRVAAAELSLRALAAAVPAHVTYRPLSELPPLRQDISVIVAAAVTADELVDAAREAGGDLLEDVAIFDRYTGDHVAADQQSIALRLTFRALDRTLTDEEATTLRTRVVDALAEGCGATLRDGE